MALIPRNLIADAARAVLRPVLHFLVRQGLPFQDFVQLAKELYVHFAVQDLQGGGNKVNVSRISAQTGIHRDEVRRIMAGTSSDVARPLGPIASIIGQWEGNPRYRTRNGSPKILTNDEFRELVGLVSHHLNSGTLLFELKRREMVRETAGGFQLVQEVMRHHDDPQRGIELLRQDMDSLIGAVTENIFDRSEQPNLHIHTAFDRIYADRLPEIRAWVLSTGATFHRQVREYLSQFDADINPDVTRPNAPTAQVVVTAFSKTEPVLPPRDEGPLR